MIHGAGKIVAVGASCGLLAATLHVATLIGLRQAELRQATQCDMCLVAGQVERDLARLEQRIAEALLPGSTTAPEDVRLRYDALVERVAVLVKLDVGDPMGRDPLAAETVHHLPDALNDVGPQLTRIDRPEVGAAALATLAPLDFELSHFVALADRFGRARTDAAEAELARLYRVLTTVLAGLVTCGAILLALLLMRHRQLGRTRDDLRSNEAELTASSHRLAIANAEVSAINAQLEARNAVLARRDRELGLQNKRFDAALNNMSLALCMVDAEERLVVYNAGFAQLFGLDLAPVPGILFADLVTMAAPRLAEVYGRQRALAVEGGETAGFVQEISAGGTTEPGEESARRSIAVSHRSLRDGGWVATYDDITERRQAERRVAYLARHDELTGLMNRSSFLAHCDAVLIEAQRRGAPAAVHCLGVDRFKEVNERFGQAVGDALLRGIGRRIVEAVGDATVARLGGDEFAVIQARPAAIADIEVMAARLTRALADPFTVQAIDIAVSASVGYAVYPADGTVADVLITSADFALATAKQAGGNVARGFEPDMDAARRDRRALEADLGLALANGELEVFFQPFVATQRLAIAGFEALLRWRHPERGQVSPALFIPLAEESGLIGEIGRWVLEEACSRAALWPGDLTLAVNLSPAQFDLIDVVGCVEQALARSGLSPTRLELEITEGVLLDGEEATLDTLRTLRSRGIRIAMDDFGTGHASLSYLRRFPFDKIKIDQSFVKDMSSRPDCIKIVQAIAELGFSLGMTTTAEGVETAEQFEELRAAGCDHVQGFRFGHPEPADRLRFTLDPALTKRDVAAA